MSTLSSASTYSEILAELADCASWEEDQDAAKARRFITAARMLLLRRPVESRHGTQTMRWDAATLEAHVAQAQAYVAATSAATNARSRVAYVSCSNFRSLT